MYLIKCVCMKHIALNGNYRSMLNNQKFLYLIQIVNLVLMNLFMMEIYFKFCQILLFWFMQL